MVLYIKYNEVGIYLDFTVVSRVWFESASGEWLTMARDGSAVSDVVIRGTPRPAAYPERETFIGPSLIASAAKHEFQCCMPGRGTWLDLMINAGYYRYVDWWRNRYFGVRGVILNVIEETEHPPLYTIVPTQLSGLI